MVGMSGIGLDEQWVRARWGAAWGLVAAGFVAIVVGGLVAAVTGPLQWDHGSWAAAYLVLVVGVVQLGLGIGQAWLAPQGPTRRRTTGELLSWNGGSLLVIAGTLVGRPVVVDAGAVLLVVGLVLFGTAVRGAAVHEGAVTIWLRRLYVVLIVIIVVTTPIGLVLAALNAR